MMCWRRHKRMSLHSVCRVLCKVTFFKQETSFSTRSVLQLTRLHRAPRCVSPPAAITRHPCGHFVALFVQSRPTPHMPDEYRVLALTEWWCYPKITIYIDTTSCVTVRLRHHCLQMRPRDRHGLMVTQSTAAGRVRDPSTARHGAHALPPPQM